MLNEWHAMHSLDTRTWKVWPSNLVSPGQIYILNAVVSSAPVNPYTVLFALRLATCNQICDPWIYILCQESRLRRVIQIVNWIKGDHRSHSLHTLLYRRWLKNNYRCSLTSSSTWHLAAVTVVTMASLKIPVTYCKGPFTPMIITKDN